MSTDNPFGEIIERIQEDITTHIEEFACAFAKYTQLPPDRIALCHTTEWRDGNIVNKIWFEEKHGGYGTITSFDFRDYPMEINDIDMRNLGEG